MTRRSSITTNTSRRSPPLPASRHNGSPSRARSTEYDRAVRPAPHRVERLPQQYFTALLAEVARHAALGGSQSSTLGAGILRLGRLSTSSTLSLRPRTSPRRTVTRPFAGCPRCARRLRIATPRSTGSSSTRTPRSRSCRGRRPRSASLRSCSPSAGRRSSFPTPTTRTTPPGPRSPRLAPGSCRWIETPAGRRTSPPRRATKSPPSSSTTPPTPAPCACPRGPSRLRSPTRTRPAPQSSLAEAGAREVGVEMFSMSKTYGMAGWRLGFVVGNAEIVARLDLLADHNRVGIFTPIQHAGIAALTGPQGSVAERVETYRRRRERVREVLPDLECEGSFYLWWELPDGLTPELLLAEHRLAVAPGEGFGSRGAGWARLSLAVTDEVLETGLERLAAALS